MVKVYISNQLINVDDRFGNVSSLFSELIKNTDEDEEV